MDIVESAEQMRVVVFESAVAGFVCITSNFDAKLEDLTSIPQGPTACDMTFASRETALLSQWEVGVGMVAGGGPMARLPRLIGRSRAMEVLLGSDDIGAELAEAYGYVNRALPDAEPDGFVDALAKRIASFDKWAIANTKRLVNAASLAPEVELAAGWEACIASVARPTTQARFKAFRELGWHRPGDAETRLGAYLERINR